MKTINWNHFLLPEINKIYFKNILYKLQKEYQKGKQIYPPYHQIFNVFKYTNLNNLKVIIIGQDPYYLKDLAHGLAFSVSNNKIIPKSLNNIYLELAYEYKIKIYKTNGNLIVWAKQGVLLLNTILTVEHNKPKSHAHLGWQYFTYNIINKLNIYCPSLVFLLWGKEAQKIIPIINKQKHYILCSSHPSPLSWYKGFYTCNHFIKTNMWLIKNKLTPINWLLPLSYTKQ